MKQPWVCAGRAAPCCVCVRACVCACTSWEACSDCDLWPSSSLLSSVFCLSRSSSLRARRTLADILEIPKSDNNEQVSARDGPEQERAWRRHAGAAPPGELAALARIALLKLGGTSAGAAVWSWWGRWRRRRRELCRPLLRPQLQHTDTLTHRMGVGVSQSGGALLPWAACRVTWSSSCSSCW